jgi:hypothetical protein
MIKNKTKNELLSDHDVENSLRKLIDNKSVAIVGNAKKLLNQSYGKDIDSHDVVIRINRGFTLAKDVRYEKTHGNKTDIVMVNLVRSINNFPRYEKIPYKIIQMTSCNPSGPFANQVEFSCRDVMMNPLLDLFSSVKPTTGLRVLHVVSLLNPLSVSVFGFDWKQESPSFYGSNDNWHTEGHDYLKEKEYCISNFASRDNWTFYS